MDKELENLLDNYENAIYGQAFPITPSIHQLHLLLDYIANLEQQCKKQKEVIDNVINIINQHFKHHPELHTENQIEYELIRKIENILKEVSK